MPTRNQLIATSVALGLVGGFVGYAAWFDYKRRNDEGFRKQLSECFHPGEEGFAGGGMGFRKGGGSRTIKVSNGYFPRKSALFPSGVED